MLLHIVLAKFNITTLGKRATAVCV